MNKAYQGLFKGYQLMKRLLIISLFLISLLILSGCGNNQATGQTIKDTATSTQQKCKNIEVPYEEQEEYLKTEYYTESVPYTDRECEAKPLVYKKEMELCQNRISGIFGVGDQKAKTSCKITNLDIESGIFSVRIGFNVVGGNQTLETTQNRFIYPQSSEIFNYEVDAKINSCYCFEQAPTKQVFRDVTKYKEVPRERQFTAYRPITKYKVERQCE